MCGCPLGKNCSLNVFLSEYNYFTDFQGFGLGRKLRYKEQHGVEQNFAFLKDPLIVNSLFLKKPERIEALGLVLLLALLLWRLVERALRLHVETTGSTLPGWDKKATQKPTAFMMMTKLAAVMVIKGGGQRQLAQPWSTVQQAYLDARGVPATSLTLSPRGGGDEGGFLG